MRATTAPDDAGTPPAGCCDVWAVPADDRPGWRHLLTPAELARAWRRRDRTARDEVVTSAALLRLVAEHCTGIPAEELTVHRRCGVCGATGHGRPWVGRGPQARRRVGPDLSVAHSAGLVVVAAVRRGRVGVDVESRPRAPELVEVARLVCGPAELAALAGVPDEARLPAFLRLWVRKEAVLKLAGLGLNGPWPAVDVLADETRPPGVWPGPLLLRDLAGFGPADGSRAPAGPVAALATTVPVTRVRHLDVRDLRVRNLHVEDLRVPDGLPAGRGRWPGPDPCPAV